MKNFTLGLAILLLGVMIQIVFSANVEKNIKPTKKGGFLVNYVVLTSDSQELELQNYLNKRCDPTKPFQIISSIYSGSEKFIEFVCITR